MTTEILTLRTTIAGQQQATADQQQAIEKSRRMLCDFDRAYDSTLNVPAILATVATDALATTPFFQKEEIRTDPEAIFTSLIFLLRETVITELQLEILEQYHCQLRQALRDFDETSESY